MVTPETVARGLRMKGSLSPVIGVQEKPVTFGPEMEAFSGAWPPPGQMSASGPASTVRPHCAEVNAVRQINAESSEKRRKDINLGD